MSNVIKTLAVAGLLATTASFTWAAVSAVAPHHAPSPATSAQSPTHQDITLYVLPGATGFTGPDHRHHDTIAPADFVLHRGVPVTLTVINYDDGLHTIFAPDLNLNITIEAGVRAKNVGGAEAAEAVAPTKTTYTFIPEQRGDFRWQCVVMCDGPSHWSMSDDYDGPGRDGFMAGWIKVL